MSDYEILKEKAAALGGCPVNGTNENGEVIIVTEGKDEEGHFFEVRTAQDNGWLRINHYYETGVMTETFEPDESREREEKPEAEADGSVDDYRSEVQKNLAFAKSAADKWFKGFAKEHGLEHEVRCIGRRATGRLVCTGGVCSFVKCHKNGRTERSFLWNVKDYVMYEKHESPEQFGNRLLTLFAPVSNA